MSLYVFIRGCHGDIAAHTTQGNDQINVNVANEAAPMPRCSASSALTRYHSRRLLMRRHTSTYADTCARARTRANTPHTDKSKTGLILVPRISYFHASIKKKKKNCGGAPTVSTQMNPACLMPSTLVCALSANQVVLTRLLKSCWKLRARRNLAEQLSHVNACCEPQRPPEKRRHLCR